MPQSDDFEVPPFLVAVSQDGEISLTDTVTREPFVTLTTTEAMEFVTSLNLAIDVSRRVQNGESMPDAIEAAGLGRVHDAVINLPAESGKSSSVLRKGRFRRRDRRPYGC